mmetsp:Transcript_14302/g.23131  ORF Transcript_14302/g.23131 Transcript_14302/m.23131 type:complete len:80 (-) Transcript_14302:1508-1747(-)
MKLQLSHFSTTTLSITTMFSLAARRTAGFTAVNRVATRAFGGSPVMFAKEGQAEVILVGCGAPNRGMGWYHAIQMLEDK